jgi:O-acetylserine/cysteine efflux transporter
LLALIVVSIWGTNFVAIKIALRELPPLLLCAVRFVFVAFPAVFFLPRPTVPFRSLLLVTLTLAAFVLKERILPVQIAGALLAGVGFLIVGIHTGGDVTLAGLACVLLGATSWGFANFTSKRLGRVNPLALVVWGSLVVPIPMGLASLAFEGPALITHSLTHLSVSTILSIAFIVYASTLIAYSLWSWLLSHHPASTVSPFALLVPIFGLLSSALILGEPLPAWKLQAAALVIAGLALNLFGPRFASSLTPRT